MAVWDGYAVSDSFNVSGPSTVTSIDFAIWNYSFDTTTNIGWAIGTTVGGSQDGSGVLGLRPPEKILKTIFM